MHDIQEILRVLPHRYPFLLIDRVLELRPGKAAKGVKNVSINEPFFPGHFPENPVMPGVLIIEALAQIGAFALLSEDTYKGSLAYLAGVDKFRFRKVVIPGDQLLLEAELIKVRGSIGKAKCRATIEGVIAAEGEILFALEAE